MPSVRSRAGIEDGEASEAGLRGEGLSEDVEASGGGSGADSVEARVLLLPRLYHRERILKTSTLSCNEEEEEITKPPTR